MNENTVNEYSATDVLTVKLATSSFFTGKTPGEASLVANVGDVFRIKKNDTFGSILAYVRVTDFIANNGTIYTN